MNLYGVIVEMELLMIVGCVYISIFYDRSFIPVMMEVPVHCVSYLYRSSVLCSDI